MTYIKARLVILLVLSSATYAQLPDSGSWLIGGDVGNLKLQPAKSSTMRYGALSVGKLLTKRTVLGIYVPVSWYMANGPGAYASIKSSNYSVMPFVRYYLTNTRLRPYLSVGAGYARGQYKARQNALLVEGSDGGLSYNGSLGIAYFVGRRFSVDGVVQYVHSPFQTLAGSTFSQAADSRLGISLRAQFFFGR